MKDEFCVCDTEDWCSWCARDVPIHRSKKVQIRERQLYVVKHLQLEEEE